MAQLPVAHPYSLDPYIYTTKCLPSMVAKEDTSEADKLSVVGHFHFDQGGARENLMVGAILRFRLY